MKKRLAVMLTVVFTAGMLAACAEGSRGDEQEKPEQTSDSIMQEDMQEETEYSVDRWSEAQLREELDHLQEKPDTLADRLAVYEELLARDLCREEDYLEMARLYGDTGDAAAQRRMLWWGFRLYPGEEYVQQLQELIIQRTEAEESVKGLVMDLQQLLEEQDAAALRTMIKSEEWMETFQEAPELYATRTLYTAENLTAQIASDACETEVFLLAPDGTCLYGRINNAGSLIASAVYGDGGYNGDADICWFDAENSLYKRYQTTLNQDICVDSILIEYEGVSYKGTLGEDGNVMETQQEKITQAGGVVYAYQTGGSRYLYQENQSIDTFRMDCTAMGLPHADIWK